MAEIKINVDEVLIEEAKRQAESIIGDMYFNASVKLQKKFDEITDQFAKSVATIVSEKTKKLIIEEYENGKHKS